MNHRDKVGPGSGRALIEKLRSLGLLLPTLSEEEIKSLMYTDRDTVLKIVEELRMSSPYLWESPESRFSFISSSSLSGWPNPTAGAARKKRVNSLGRFAALYADTVLIPDPFENIVYQTDPELAGHELVVTLQVLHILRPQIEAGLVRFAPYHFPLRSDHKQKVEQIEREYREDLEQLREPILDDMLGDLSVSFEETEHYPFLKIDGAQKYFPEDQIDLLIESAAKGDSRYPSEEIARDLISETLLEPVFSDLHYRHLFRRFYDAHYLSDRPIDRDVLFMLDEDTDTQGAELGAEIEHALPFLENIDTDTLTRLREEEGEAFQVYRERVAELVKESPKEPDEFREAFRDLVEPELGEIDKAVKNAREMAKQKLERKITVGTGIATLGLTTGAVSPEIGTILSALGGYKFGVEALSELQTLFGEPAAARQKDFFYLWKAQRESRID